MSCFSYGLSRRKTVSYIPWTSQVIFPSLSTCRIKIVSSSLSNVLQSDPLCKRALISNLDEGAHCSLLPYSWPAKLYKTMSGLQTWTFIVFFTELQNPYSFIVFNLVIWESGARYSFKVIWVPPSFLQFLKKIFILLSYLRNMSFHFKIFSQFVVSV